MTDKELMQQALVALEMYWVKAEHLRTAVNDAQARQTTTTLKARLRQLDLPETNLGDMPKKAAWVGLTDGEIKGIIGPWGGSPVKGYTRTLFDQIEAKLKEKNTL